MYYTALLLAVTRLQYLLRFSSSSSSFPFLLSFLCFLALAIISSCLPGLVGWLASAGACISGSSSPSSPALLLPPLLGAITRGARLAAANSARVLDSRFSLMYLSYAPSFLGLPPMIPFLLRASRTSFFPGTGGFGAAAAAAGTSAASHGDACSPGLVAPLRQDL